MARKIEVKGVYVDKLSAPAKKSTDSVRKSFGGVKKAIGAAIGVLAVKQVFSFTNSVAKMQDQMAKFGRTMGLSAKQVSGWTFAVQLGGGSIETLNTGLRTLSRNMADAQKGTGLGLEAFRALNIEVMNSDGSLRDMDQVMLEVSDKFSDMEDGATKSALAQKLFGKAGTDLINTLNGGSDALREQIREGQELSRITDQSAKAAEDYNDAMLRLETSFKGFGVSAFGALTPLIERIVLFNKTTLETIDHLKAMQDLNLQVERAELKRRLTLIAYAEQQKKAGGVLSSQQEETLSRLKKTIPKLKEQAELGQKEYELMVLRANLGQKEKLNREQGANLEVETLKEKIALLEKENEVREKSKGPSLPKTPKTPSTKSDDGWESPRANAYASENEAIAERQTAHNELMAQREAEHAKRLQEQQYNESEIARQAQLEQNKMMEEDQKKYQDGVEKSEEKSLKKRAKLREDHNKMLGKTASNGIAMMTTLAPKNKALARTEVGIQTGVAVMNALATKPFFPLGLSMAGLATAKGVQALKGIDAAAEGADFVTNKPQLLLVGDNSGAQEHVQVKPVGTKNTNGPQGSDQPQQVNINLNIDGNVDNSNLGIIKSSIETLADNVVEALRSGALDLRAESGKVFA